MPLRKNPAPASRRSHGFRPGLETLEDRVVMTSMLGLDLAALTGIDANAYAPDHILVRYAPDAAPTPSLTNTTVGQAVDAASGLYTVRLGTGVSVDLALAAYRADPTVLAAEPDYYLGNAQVPNDSRFADQWGLRNVGQSGGKYGADIHATAAWDATRGNRRVVVSVMDTGVDYTHPDLYKNIWINQGEIPPTIKARLRDLDGDGQITFLDLNNAANQGAGKIVDVNKNGRIDGADLLAPTSQGGWADRVSNDGDAYVDDIIGWNFSANNNNPLDNNGHGTHVSGIIGASGNNGQGVAGVAWNVQLMPVKFLDAGGGGTVSEYISALNYAVAHGAKISNNSWSGAAYSQTLVDAVNNARARGHIVVAAAGNNGLDNDKVPTYPASLALNNVVSVAATDRNDQLAAFSNYGATSVDLAAPGLDILSTIRGGGYGFNSGTSMATPFVTGVLALVWGANPSWTYNQVIQRVLNTADKLPSLQGKLVTGGRVDAAAAVGLAQATATAPHVTTATFSGASGTISAVRLTFDHSINAATFTAADVRLTTPSGQSVSITGVRAVTGTNNQTFDVFFTAQRVAGSYTLRVGPDVRDASGVAMIAYQTTHTLGTAPTGSAPRVTGAVFSGAAGTLSSVRLTFDHAINPATFTTADVRLTTPSGQSVSITGVRVIAGTSNRIFDVFFTAQRVAGSYTLRVGPDVRDASGVAMIAYQTTHALGSVPTGSAPRVTGAVFSGAAGTISAVRLTFDHAINPATFTTADVRLTTPSGQTVTITAVRVIAGTSNRIFDVFFTAQRVAGSYTLRVGPDVRDASGVAMIAYQTTHTLGTAPTGSAPRVTGAVFSGAAGTLSSVRLTFDHAINPATFTTADVRLTTPSGQTVTITAVRVIAGTSNRIFDVFFTAQRVAGSYTLRVGPDVRDASGVAMIAYQTTHTLGTVPTGSAPRVTGAVFSGAAGTLSSVRLTFDHAINPATFTTADVRLTTPSGQTVTITAVRVIAGTSNRIFDVFFTAQRVAGSYTLRVGPDVRDASGVAMIAYQTTHTLGTAPTGSAPRVTGAVFSGAAGTLSSVRLTFDHAINPATFTTADVRLTTPSGQTVTITAVRVIAGSSNRIFDVFFTAQRVAGSYTLRVGPDVRDASGVAMIAYQTTHTIQGTLTRTYTMSSASAIPRGGRAVSQLTVPYNTTIQDINVRINVSFPNVSHLLIHLQAPDGTDILLARYVGSGSANFTNTVFDDQASNLILFGQAPYTGSYKPMVALQGLNGKNAQGSWKLWVEDRGGVYSGTLTNWSLVIRGNS